MHIDSTNEQSIESQQPSFSYQKKITCSTAGIKEFLEMQYAKAEGIFLGCEGALMPTGGSDLSDLVDLERMEGNPSVIRALKTMLNNTQATFFPGTLLEKRGDHIVQSMPIIGDGKILDVCTKLTEPKVSYPNRIEQHASTNQTRRCYFHPKFGNIFPIICNELGVIPTPSQVPDLLLHSCYHLFDTAKDAKSRYETLFNKWDLPKGTRIVVAHSEPHFAAEFRKEKTYLERIS